MSFLQIAFLAVGLGCDAFAVAAAVATRGTTKRQTFRLSFHFGLFQFMMPLIGWFVSMSLLVYVEALARWIAFALLAAIAGKMFYESFRERERSPDMDKTRGWSLVILSFATSQDALGVGLGMGLMNYDLFAAALWIGLTASAMTLLGVFLGGKLSEKFGKRVEAAGALLLMFIAVSLLFSLK